MRAVRYVILSSLLAAVGCGGMEQAEEQSSAGVSPNGLAGSFAKPTGQSGLGNVSYHGESC
ncbi:MAG: hypothetical protein ACXU86_00705 [Archangium sp.]